MVKKGPQTKLSQSDLDLVANAVKVRGVGAAQIAKEQAVKVWSLRAARKWAQKVKSGKQLALGRAPGGARKAEDSAALCKIRNCLNADGQTISHNVVSLAREIKVPRHQVRYARDKTQIAEHPRNQRGWDVRRKHCRQIGLRAEIP